MRSIRPLFFVKCFLIGGLFRVFIFGVALVKERIFSDAFSGRRDARIGHIRHSSFSPENSPSYTADDFGERTIAPLFGGNRNGTRRMCTMSNCFNFSRCRGIPFKVHIYPTATLEALLTESNDSSTISTYAKILSSVVHSGYYTSDPTQACLFIVAYDTLDRDSLSADYVKNLQSKFSSLPRSIWNNGENHLIFNLYQGTWPDYDVTDLGIDTGKAILVKASFSVSHFRPFFDISFPLFHRILPLSSVDYDDGLFRPIVSTGDYGHDAKRRRYLFSFKGKRYVHGIGSETRNSLYHLHDNGQESVVITTCRHGKNWHQVKDERCDEDNESYDKWGTYEWLLSNSDYCLIPRGRRLGSYRFLESLQYGCVPTMLANGWELPFSEIVTWSEAAVMADERLLSTVPDTLHDIKPTKAFILRSNAKRYSQMYFSSVERIVSTTLEIVKRRLRPWISSPLDNYSQLSGPSASEKDPRFHAYIIVGKRNQISSKRLLDAISASAFCSQITVLCFDCSISMVTSPVPINVSRLSVSSDWLPLLIPDNNADHSDAVFWINALSPIHFSTDEIDFAAQVWRWFPSRLVGFFSRRLQHDGRISSKLLNDFTFVTGAAVLYHKSYNEQLTSILHSLPPERRMECFDQVLNWIAMQRGMAPIKLTARYQVGKTAEMHWGGDCIGNEWRNSPVAEPSRVRFDPLLYKDPVSNLRKKYKQMELNNVN